MIVFSPLEGFVLLLVVGVIALFRKKGALTGLLAMLGLGGLGFIALIVLWFASVRHSSTPIMPYGTNDAAVERSRESEYTTKPNVGDLHREAMRKLLQSVKGKSREEQIKLYRSIEDRKRNSLHGVQLEISDGQRWERYPDGMLFYNDHGERELVGFGNIDAGATNAASASPRGRASILHAAVRQSSAWRAFVLLGALLLGLLVILKAAFTRSERQKAGGALGFALAGTGLLLFLVFLWFLEAREVRVRDVKSQELTALATQEASIAELHERLNLPQIDLDDLVENPAAIDALAKTSEPTPDEEHPAPEGKTEQAKPQPAAEKPAWVGTPPKRIGDVNRRTITAGPYRTIDECYENLERPLLTAVTQHLEQLIGIPSNRLWSLQAMGIHYETVLREFCTEEYIETIESPTVGEMKRLHVLVEFGPAQDALLIERWQATERQERLIYVVLAAALVLGAIALVVVLLKLDDWTRGYYSKRLFLGVPAAIIAIVGVIALFA